MKKIPAPSIKNHIPLIALCFGSFMVILDVTIVNVALPDMAKNLQGNTSWLQWVVAGYTLTFACLLLSAGNLADRVGTKSIYLLGLILFTLSSIGCGLSFNFLLLTAMRLLQGVGAALLLPTSLALINASYKNQPERVKAISIWGATSAIAAALGPILGGVLTFYFGWRSVFFVNVPLGVVAFLLTKKFVINPPVSGKGHFDFLGQTLGAISIAALAFSLIEAGRFGWFSEVVIIAFSIFMITIISFLIVEYRTSSPMLPLHFFKSQKFSAAIALGMIINIGWYGELFVLTLYFQHIRDYSVLMTGFAFIPFVGLNALAAYLGGKWASISGARSPMLFGLSCSAAGFFSLLMTQEHTPYVLLILPLICLGAGIAFMMPATTVTAIHSVPEGRAGIASGAFNASRQIGSLLGVAIFGTIIAMSKYFMVGMRETLIIGGILYLCGCAVVLLWISAETR